MRRTLCAVAAVAGLLSAFAEPVGFKAETDHADGLYRCGEEAVFTVTATNGAGEAVRSGVLTVILDNFGNRRAFPPKTVDLSRENPFIVRGTLADPGTLRLSYFGKTAEGKPMGGLWTASFDVAGIRPASARPKDFDAFWDEAFARFAANPAVTVRRIPVGNWPTKKGKAYRIEVTTGVEGRVIRGQLAIPAGKGPWPLRVHVPGAGQGSWGVDSDPDAIRLVMNVHGSAEEGKTRYYEQGIGGAREDYFFYLSILAVNRAVREIVRDPAVKRDDITYFGGSQGGAFGIILAAFNPEFTRVWVSEPALTDLCGLSAGRQSGWPKLPERAQEADRPHVYANAAYFDCAHFAARIKCPIRFMVGSIDEICPPHCVYSAYNAVPATTDKKIEHAVGVGHNVPDATYKPAIRKFLAPDTAAVELGTPFADGMVLQRDRPVAVWGKAGPRASVRVAFAGQEKTTTAKEDGSWRLDLDPMPASSEGRDMVVEEVKSKSEKVKSADVLSLTQTLKHSNTRTILHDVLVGEVWFAGGQSNMDCPISGGAPRYRDRHGAMIAQMTHLPLVRYAYAKGSWSKVPRAFNGRLVWKRLEPQNLLSKEFRGQMSAVAFYYARELHLALGVPVGIVEAHVGGTGIATWTPHEGFLTRPDLRDYADWKYYDETNWPKTKEFQDYPMTDPCQQPSGYYNGVMNPLVPYTCRGMIWYQGCHNYKDPERYASLMHALHDGLRTKFADPHFRLYYAQLAGGFGGVAQRQAQYEREADDAAMAVICEYHNPSDVHPWDKEPVARRLLLKALKRDYGFADIEDSSPVPTAFSVSNDVVTVSLAHADDLYLYNPDRSLRNNFRLAGEDGKWVRAEILNFVVDEAVKAESRRRDGKLVGAEVRVRAPGVAHPVRLDYHVEPPYAGEIYNRANLPLGPFVRELLP